MINESTLLATGKPADFSFRKMRVINVPKFLETVGLEGARLTRVGGVPERGDKKKFLTRAIWLNNNRLINIKQIDELAETVLEYPEQLAWLDFSFNYITAIDECILKFKKLKIVYLHGNCLSDLDEIYKLRPLKELKTLTVHGNPVANHPRYRSYVVAVLPQLMNLDFTPVIPTEKMAPYPPEVVKKFKDEEKRKAEANKQ